MTLLEARTQYTHKAPHPLLGQVSNVVVGQADPANRHHSPPGIARDFTRGHEKQWVVWVRRRHHVPNPRPPCPFDAATVSLRLDAENVKLERAGQWQPMLLFSGSRVQVGFTTT
ncbi:hypothetical protein BCR44DRAFT_1430950 [Catenaria anguillulae PL171]|uniref:Uncharacterized protein n=1 Tax=Catenaria anguillulae PL171 TaxID=765915 RepID=A0A1Y2HRX2_9FUNG|nr:hypothetical protein BCR44DRAFT_1430950 [Catenaria anguillulae PL171]